MTTATTYPVTSLFATPEDGERFSAIPDPDSEPGRSLLAKIAARIAREPQPAGRSDIPAGSTYMAQFVVHDLDFVTRDGTAEGSLLDLAVLYGDGPKHDAFAYQVPSRTGAQRYLLRIGRTRTTPTSPPWGAARDLPRAACPHLDARAVDSKSEVMVPNSFSDSNLLFGQVQTLWALLHNAIAGRLAETRDPRTAFELARRVNRRIYRDVIRTDVLGTWLHPDFRDRYAAATPAPLWQTRISGSPREFMAGVGRMGHALVREIYSLNQEMPVVGLRNMIRHTSTGRPHEMPLTEAWLVDFARFFAIDGSRPQLARALGPHVSRPFGDGPVVATDAPDADGLVLRDLRACARSDLLSVRALIARADTRSPGLFDKYFARYVGHWSRAIAAWLADTGIAREDVRRLAADPPLKLFLLLEAEADTQGRTLGALGSVLMGETLLAAMPAADADPALDAAAAEVFRGPAPGSMADVIRFLQGHYNFAEGARLYDTGAGAARPTRPVPESGVRKMLDSQTTAIDPIPRIEVADFVEMGKLVAEWATGRKEAPEDAAELREQLRGIAEVPDRIKFVKVVQGSLDTLVIRLPVREMVEQSLMVMDDPMAEGSYPFPQFYSDYYNPGFGPVMSPLDILYARVGDYTIAQCR